MGQESSRGGLCNIKFMLIEIFELNCIRFMCIIYNTSFCSFSILSYWKNLNLVLVYCVESFITNNFNRKSL
jgi:hypothetical protein